MTNQNASIDLIGPEARAIEGHKQFQAVETYLVAVQIQGPEMTQWAVTAGKQIREQMKAHKAERDSVLKPLKAIDKKIRGWFKPGLDLGDRLLLHLRTAIRDEQARVEAEQTAALQEATTHEEIAQAVQTLAPKPEGYHETTNWKWEIEDETKIPRDYYILDTARIDREVKGSQDKTNIPGIRPVAVKVPIIR